MHYISDTRANASSSYRTPGVPNVDLRSSSNALFKNIFLITLSQNDPKKTRFSHVFIRTRNKRPYGLRLDP